MKLASCTERICYEDSYCVVNMCQTVGYVFLWLLSGGNMEDISSDIGICWIVYSESDIFIVFVRRCGM